MARLICRDRLVAAARPVLHAFVLLSLVFGVGYGIVFDLSPGRLPLIFANPRRSDFALYYRDARVGLDFGWGRIYDRQAHKIETDRLGVISKDPHDLPSLSVPLLTWMVAPLALLSLDSAYRIWTAVVAACLAASFLLLCPDRGRDRAIHAGLFATFAPVGLTVGLGQSVALVLLAVAAGSRLLRSGHPWVSGFAFGLALVKPQLVLALPVCLLVAGHWRAVAGFGLVGLAVLAAWLAVVGPGELIGHLAQVGSVAEAPSTFDVPRDIAPVLAMPGTLGRLAFAVAVVLVAAIASRRPPRTEHALAAGIVASLLVTPYIHYQDLVLLFAAAWLLLSVARSSDSRRLAAVAYGQASLAISTLPLLEIGWLVYAAARRPGRQASQARMEAIRST